MTSTLRSGEVAAAAGVNLQTLRYYERRGLLSAPERSLGGHRRYPAETVTLLRAIKAGQRLGFTLDEVAELVHPGGRSSPQSPDPGFAARARAKLAQLEAEIADLRAVAETLRETLAAGCDDMVECAHTPCCPIPFATPVHDSP